MKKKRAAAAAVAAVTTAGVAVGGAFPSPGTLLWPEDGAASAPITEVLVPLPTEEDDLPDDSPDGEDEDGLRRRRSPAALFRTWVLELPMAVRAGVGVPLWCLGWLALTAVSGLWSALLSPALGTALFWVAVALVLAGTFLLTAKAALPETPLKRIINRRSLLGLLAGTAVIALADGVLPLFFDGYDRWGALLRAAAPAALLCAVTGAYLHRERRRQRVEAAEAARRTAEEEPETREQAQERAMRFVRELVDEVSPRRRYQSR